VSLPSLATARLSLTPATRADVEALWHVWREPEVRRYQFDDLEVTRERAEEIVAAGLAHAREGLGLWAVRESGQEGIVGVAGLRPVETGAEEDAGVGGMVEVLVSLARGAWGRGYAAEALGAAIAYGFTSLGLARLAAIVDLPNARSHRLVQRLGFVAVGEGDGPRYRFRAYVLAPPG
jgi:RimJ/RimL family protein N-acetyltransferase